MTTGTRKRSGSDDKPVTETKAAEVNKADTNTVSAVAFDALIYAIATMPDGGYKVTLELPETALAAVTTLMMFKSAGVNLRVAIAPDMEGE